MRFLALGVPEVVFCVHASTPLSESICLAFGRVDVLFLDCKPHVTPSASGAVISHMYCSSVEVIDMSFNSYRSLAHSAY